MIEFDHTSDHHAARWREIYAEARGKCPVVHSDLHGGYYVLTRHEDVFAVLKDHAHFSSERSWDEQGNDKGLGVAIPPQPVRVGILEMDPPESLKYRRLLNAWFTGPAIERGRGRIAEAATWAIDRVIEKGQCDVVSDLAGPFQCVLLLDLLGVPLERWATYADVAERMVRQTDDRAEGVAWMRDDVAREVARQRTDGGDGLIGGLVKAEVDGELITLEWATELVMMLLLGGEGTTIATIAHMLQYLDTRQADRERLSADPSMMPTAVDEIFRVSSPSPGLARTVTSPVRVGDHDFEAGDRVLLSFASANLDETVFANASEPDITRYPNPHLAFGGGAHRCIGSLLARANTEMFVSEVLRRMPDYRIVTDEVRSFDRIPLTNGFFSMPMQYTSGTRVETEVDDLPTLTADRIRPR